MSIEWGKWSIGNGKSLSSNFKGGKFPKKMPLAVSPLTKGKGPEGRMRTLLRRRESVKFLQQQREHRERASKGDCCRRARRGRGGGGCAEGCRRGGGGGVGLGLLWRGHHRRVSHHGINGRVSLHVDWRSCGVYVRRTASRLNGVRRLGGLDGCLSSRLDGAQAAALIIGVNFLDEALKTKRIIFVL